MEAALKVDVISKEIVKPSRPTPTHRKTFTLSFLDENSPAFHVPRHLIYDTSLVTEVPPFNDLITSLKNSLSETLTHFPPLAGRFENAYTVSCNDEGIPFVATHVNCRLRDVLVSPRKFDLLVNFLPPQEYVSMGQRPVSEVVPLAFQFNVFQCGGVILGCYSIHKLIDVTSMSCFLNYWAATASKRVDDLVEPDFDAIIKAFPPLPLEKREAANPAIASGDNNGNVGSGGSSGKGSDTATAQPAVEVGLSQNANNPPNGNDGSSGKGLDNATAQPKQVGLSQYANSPKKVVAKSFKFSTAVIKKLKANAASEAVPNPSSFEVVAGFVWKHAMAAISQNDSNNVPNTLSFSASLRARTNPPLTKQSMGNIIVTVRARVTGPDAEPGEIVREIHAAVATVTQRVADLQGENGGEKFLAESKAEFLAAVRNKSSTFTLSNWCKVGFNRVDFGFGKPTNINPLGILYPFLSDYMILVDYSDPNGDEGIEVFVCLVDNHMSFLEANPQFLAFASR